MNERADRYRRLSHRFTDIIAAVPEDRWSAPSPCEGWTARDVVDHVVSTEADFLAKMGFDAPAIDATDARASWAAVRDAVQAHLDDPEDADHEYDGWFGRTTFAASIDTFYSLDLAVHGWDLARAAGLDEYTPIAADELAIIHAAVEQMGDNARMPGVFGPTVPVASDADEQTRVLAETGRKA